MKKSIIILTLSNGINKVLGAGYHIALVYLLTSEGVGLLNNALNVYTTLVVLFTSGFATALAKLIAENETAGRHLYAHRLFQLSFVLFLVIGIFAGMLMYVSAIYLAVDSDVNLSIYVLIPALLLISQTTIFRGYYQGIRYMTPIALAQTAEQIVKIVVGAGLAIFFMPDLRLAAFGAAMGFTAGALVSWGIFVISYGKSRKKLHEGFVGEKVVGCSLVRDRKLLRSFLGYVVPVSICGFMVQMVGVVDQFMINKILPLAGFGANQVKLIYGVMTGQVAKLIDIPSVITIAIAVNMMPHLAAEYQRGAQERIRLQTASAYRLAMFVSIPAAFGLSFLGQPIMQLVYRNHADVIGGAMLTLLAYSSIFIGMIQINSSVLQGVNRLYLPMKAALYGFVVKLLCSSTLLFWPDRAIFVIAIGTLGFYIVTGAISFHAAIHAVGIDGGVLFVEFAKAAAISLVMAISTVYIYERLCGIWSIDWATVAAIGFGIIFYGLMTILFQRRSLWCFFERQRDKMI